MTPRLPTSVFAEIEQLSTSRRRSPTFWSSNLDAIDMSSVLLVFSLIDLISSRVLYVVQAVDK